jgi:enoyl-CoA hydratase/carnithine racemase
MTVSGVVTPDDSALVGYQLDESVAILTLQRPERLNAWTPEMEGEWNQVLDRATADDAVRAVVVTGAGRGFCSGMDTAVLAQRSRQGPPPKRARALTSLADLPKPVVGAINGPAVGLGFALALCCDVRFGSERTMMSTGFAPRGLVAEFGTSWRLPRLVGQARAMDLLLSGRACEGEEARDLGLLNWLVPAEELVKTAQDYAADLARRCSPLAMAVIKGQVAADWERTRTEAENVVADLSRLPSYRRDMAEGVASVREHRLPAFPPLGERPSVPLPPRR